MSLVGSLITPEGIIIAGDSLATITGSLKLKGSYVGSCISCKENQAFVADFECPGLPLSTFPFSQKVFPFLKQFGIGTVGIGQLGLKTIYFLLRQLEHDLESKKSIEIDEVAKNIASYLHDKLMESTPEFEKADENWSPLGVQIVGYKGKKKSNSNPLVINLAIGKIVREEQFECIGDYWSGQTEVVTMLRGLANSNPAFNCFNLQDAIDYAEFIIDTTARSQRFSSRLPNVGGDIDIALVTPFDQFQWIKKKQLR